MVPEEILVDSETWGTRELLEVIASRFFDLGNEVHIQIPGKWWGKMGLRLESNCSN